MTCHTTPAKNQRKTWTTSCTMCLSPLLSHKAQAVWFCVQVAQQSEPSVLLKCLFVNVLCEIRTKSILLLKRDDAEECCVKVYFMCQRDVSDKSAPKKTKSKVWTSTMMTKSHVFIFRSAHSRKTSSAILLWFRLCCKLCCFVILLQAVWKENCGFLHRSGSWVMSNKLWNIWCTEILGGCMNHFLSTNSSNSP